MLEHYLSTIIVMRAQAGGETALDVSVYMYRYVCVHVWVYVCMCVWVYVCMCVWVYVCMCVWVYVCMCVWVYILKYDDMTDVVYRSTLPK